jgi:hypothetical protein
LTFFPQVLWDNVLNGAKLASFRELNTYVVEIFEALEEILFHLSLGGELVLDVRFSPLPLLGGEFQSLSLEVRDGGFGHLGVELGSRDDLDVCVFHRDPVVAVFPEDPLLLDGSRNIHREESRFISEGLGLVNVPLVDFVLYALRNLVCLYLDLSTFRGRRRVESRSESELGDVGPSLCE